jgi:hypothetical protein
MLCSLVLTGCDKLDDSDNGLVSEVLPGEWAFSYIIRSEVDPGLEFEYKQVIFNNDGTCAITYIDGYEQRVDEKGNPVKDEKGNNIFDPIWGALHGTYVANSTMIRIVSSDIGNEERVMLWRIVTLSAKQIVAEYDFTMDGTSSMTAVVTLDKQKNY